MILLIEHVYKISQSHTLQASKLVFFIVVKQSIQQVLRHDGDLSELHCGLLHLPQVEGGPERAVAYSGEDEVVGGGNQEGEDNTGRVEGLDFAPRTSAEIKKGNEAGVDSEDIEPALEEGGGERLGRVSGAEIRGEMRA
ncbi:hypothetical protein ACFX2A_003962 [Malus domestica]